jgi:hypothetical protein
LLTAAWLLFGVASTVGAMSVGRFFYPNVSFERSTLVLAGEFDSYDYGVSQRLVESADIWMVRGHDGIRALHACCPLGGG